MNAYIEITPYDGVKYEIDKRTGYLRVDRPQRTSSLPPTLYGFIPQTYCAKRVGQLSPAAENGDHDPLDICVISERPIDRSEVLLTVRVIGGLHMIDHGEADDKIIGILDNDPFWNHVENLPDIPDTLIERLSHYFRTYKMQPGDRTEASIESVYHRQHAWEVIRSSLEDYREKWGE